MTFESDTRSSVGIVDGLKVSQLAELTGVPGSTLRYYEQQGLLAPRRSTSGYRLFDDQAVDQLRFIATAKSLGLSLEDVRALLAPWRREGCREVQRAMAPMLQQRSDEAREQIARLDEFVARLGEAIALLDEIDREGACDRSCVFLRQEPAATSSSDSPARHAPATAATATGGTEPKAAPGRTQQAPAWRDRQARWQRLMVHARSRRRTTSGQVRISFDPAVLDVEDGNELIDLVRAEQQRCPALAMTVIVGTEVVVEASAPDDAATNEIVESLFGPFDPSTDGAGLAMAAGSARCGS